MAEEKKTGASSENAPTKTVVEIANIGGPQPGEEDFAKWVREQRGEDYGVDPAQVARELAEEEDMDDDEFEARYVEAPKKPEKKGK